MDKIKLKRYGWWPDIPDARDARYMARPAILAAMPTSVDLRPGCPPIYDQGELGSCTANAIAAALDFDRGRQELAFMAPSRLFIYWAERDMEGSVAEDSGAMIRDGMKVVSRLGAPEETFWPYDIAQFAARPPETAYIEAEKHQALRYMRLTPLETQLKACLAEGFPFVFGFAVYDGFESHQVAITGEAELPGLLERQVGGHAVLAVGYDDTTRRFLVRNSWGEGWGQHGYFTLPYAYLTDANLADDFWTVRLVEAG